jgi:hypothetical protein
VKDFSSWRTQLSVLAFGHWHIGEVTKKRTIPCFDEKRMLTQMYPLGIGDVVAKARLLLQRKSLSFFLYDCHAAHQRQVVSNRRERFGN